MDTRNPINTIITTSASLALAYITVDGRIILKWILGKQGGRLWTGFIWFRIETSGGLV
jgi:hypothetical protein